MRRFSAISVRHNWRRHCLPIKKLYSSSSSSKETIKDINDLDMPKVYAPGLVERKHLERWKGLERKPAKDGSVFRMLLPPPNVTGKLHLGHFLTLTVEDTIARWKIMSGVNVEWIPGFDHAGIATQSVVSRKLAKKSNQGQGLDQIGDSLVNFSSSNLKRIREQIESTGALLNWDKGYYTLNEAHSSVVQEAFIQLFESGLIRRTDSIVNWSCALKTTIADIEVDEVDFDKKISIRVPNYEQPVDFGVLYHIAYRCLDSDEKLVVATSRPETMFGDVALAVNPEDARNVHYVGKRVINPVNGSIIPVVADERVKPDFGTGVVKVTPAHDKLDFAIGTSQNLGAITIYTNDGILNDSCGEMKGLPRFVARTKVLELLNNKNALVDAKPYAGAVRLCSRSGDVIEPRLIPHWFLQTQFLSNKLIQAITDKSLVIVPEHHSRALVSRLIDSQDWCLSRQIQWGHKIPAFYHVDFPEKWVVSKDIEGAVKKLEALLGQKIEDTTKICQDSDVLDTWFSSALIPLTVSGWPDAEVHKEISLMETGHDILLFWVWRMVILTIALANRLPFRHVLLHGIVTDNYGRKMSKSRGNVIDPLHIINGISYKELLSDADAAYASGELDENEYNLRKVTLQRNHSGGFATCGNDALRMTLLSQDLFQDQVTLDLSYLESCKRFSNKLWQALRFLKFHSPSNSTPSDSSTSATDDSSEIACKWLLSCLYDFNRTCETSLNQATFHLYAEAVRKFFYLQLCDVYIELIKGDIKRGADVSKHIRIMQYAFETGMKLAHPIIPFVTEEIWSYLRGDGSSILQQDYPSSKELEHFYDPNLMIAMTNAVDLIHEIRSAKRRSGWGTKTVPDVYVEMPAIMEQRLRSLAEHISKLSNSKVAYGRYPVAQKSSFGSFLVEVSGQICRIHLPLLDPTFNVSSQAKIEKLKLRLMKLQQQYESPSFQQSAPPALKEKLKRKVENLIIQIQENSNNNPNQRS